MLHPVAQLVGVALVALALADVYLTVLYARSGTGIISRSLGLGTWQAFRWIGARAGSRRDLMLTYAGPTVLVALATVWSVLLFIGFGLLFWPLLGTSIQSTHGATPTSLAAAIYYAGSSATTAGAGDLHPVTAASRLMTVVNSGIGISVITLTLTYFVQIYTALQRRNALVLRLHQATDCTGDAAELLAGMGPVGDFTDSRRVMAELAGDLADVYEAHHFYGALVLFRFREPFYAMPRALLVVMDFATLVRTALDGAAYPGVTKSGAVAQLWQGGLHMLDQLSRVFLPPRGQPNRGNPPDAARAEQWRPRYADALVTLRNAGIRTVSDERGGAEAYVAQRGEWDGYVRAFAAYLAHPMELVDPAGTRAV